MLLIKNEENVAGRVACHGFDGRRRARLPGPGSTLTITVGSASVNRALTRVLEHTTVRGHPATVSYDPGFEEDILIAWDEDATHAASVYQIGNYDEKHPSLTADQLLRIANSLH